MTATRRGHVATMGDSIRETFPTGRIMASRLTTVSQGMSADAILDGKADLPIDDGSILTLPKFAIRHYGTSESVNLIQWDSGRTTRAIEHGTRLVIPWQVEDSTLPTISGTLIAEPGPLGHTIVGDLPPVPDGARPTVHPVTTRREADRVLRRIAEQGRTDAFVFCKMLAPFARKAVLSADVRVYREIHGITDQDCAATGRIGHVLDDAERDIVLDKLMWGTDDTGSILLRLVRRVAGSDLTRKKSVAAVIATGIWSGAETLVRQHIGDPHLGRLIRRLARALQTQDPELVLTHFRDEYPESKLGINRVVAALTAGSTINAQSVPMFAEDEIPV